MNSQIACTLTPVPAPAIYHQVPTPVLSDATMQSRLNAVLSAMQQQGLSSLVIYADKEHGGNFEYLSGFIPRFEEALLVVNVTGELTYIMGNENLKLVPHARNGGTCLHAPVFSLPNQPMKHHQPLHDLLSTAGVTASQKTGIAGWKLFRIDNQPDHNCFDVPAFILDAVRIAAGGPENVVNATGLFIAPENGVRCINNANEVAFYEYGANLASSVLLEALDAIAPGKTEKEIGQLLAGDGQQNSVILIAATGDRFAHANLYPSDKIIRHGDKFSLTVGYKGGLSSRAAYVVASEEELPSGVADWLPRLAIPYYHTVVSWLENLHIGMRGGDLYRLVAQTLEQKTWNWHLNPGHLVADEEWLCSPVYPDSAVRLASGMLFQIDIIPSLPGYGGCSIEDTVALADEALRRELESEYPQVWQRMVARRKYLSHVLNIHVSDDVILLSNIVGYLRPFLLDPTRALVRR
jgi:Xaa-Pro aminopeptidase